MTLQIRNRLGNTITRRTTTASACTIASRIVTCTLIHSIMVVFKIICSIPWD